MLEISKVIKFKYFMLVMIDLYLFNSDEKVVFDMIWYCCKLYCFGFDVYGYVMFVGGGFDFVIELGL